ncbi:SFT2-like domain-containing protein, putative [Eimeria tenella]|uniref:Vesicle transport protein n=1 Tax=Eimeria tenella TaxID=5802 RepID=U6KM75_EIMTE|nr:SFT2-like domain-containing protein, putative [Eimeria tenella]CDJ39217.1 SFT2-like domain-containing protein, putative [Eimeria tenella]|eukprot:XP_013229972.1 SFT2-like domain-containing protein, putative [Eimeria tenella]
MMGSQQSFGDFANSLSFYGGTQQQEKKGYAMVSLDGTPMRGGSTGGKPAVPGFLGNILGTKAGAAAPEGMGAGAGIWATPGRLPSGPMKPSSRQQEQNGLLQSGLSAVKDGASRMLDGANSVVNATRATISDNPLSSQNMLMFGVVAAVGVLFMFLAFLTLPLLVFAPSKFALLFTMGSLCFLAALALLRGVAALSRHLVEPSRLPFTAVYFSSLFLTLYATLMAKSYVLTLVFSVLQLCGLTSFLVSYIPGGSHMLKFMGQAAWQLLRKAFKCGGSRDLQLPM